MKKIGVLLSGCGVFDGTEIYESVMTMLALDRHGAKSVCMAPNMEQHHVINHLTGDLTKEKRNVLVESARLAQGRIKDLSCVAAEEIDGLILPGGFGTIKNLSNFNIMGKAGEVHPEVKRLILEVHEANKPIGGICVSPAVLALVLQDRNPEVTIGNDMGTAEAIEEMGGVHCSCGVDGIHVDETNMLVTTPAFMIGPRMKDVAEGIEKLVLQVLEMAESEREQKILQSGIIS